MNVLILTCRFGMGHYAVASVLESKLQKMGHSTNIVDVIDYVYPISSIFIYKIFELLVTSCPKLYNSAVKNGNGDKPALKAFGTAKLKRLVKKYNADIVVSTFPICSGYASSLKDNDKFNFKLYTYITDIYPHKEWVTKNNDIYFVASEDTKSVLIDDGVEESKIVTTGIPVKPEFYSNKKSHDKKNILIMGGGLGIIPNSDMLIDELIKEKDLDIRIIVGKNKKLESTLKNKYSNIDVIGYTDKVHEYMENADVILTKPGGITVFEAIRSKTPMCIIKPFLEQEYTNAEFIDKNEMGIIVDPQKSDFCQSIINLLNDDERLSLMQKNMDKFSNELEDVCPSEFY